MEFIKTIALNMSSKGRVLKDAARELNKPDLIVYVRKKEFEKLKEEIGQDSYIQLRYALGAPRSLFLKTLTWEDAAKMVKLTNDFEKLKKDAENVKEE